MWGASDEPPGTMEGGPPESMIQPKESCEQNKNQLEMLKEIMIRNKQSLKKKEEEVQEYARRLSKIKQSRRNKEGSSHSKDPTLIVKPDTRVTENVEDTIDDISQAKTPKAKSSLLQRKLAENRKVFEQRSKEMTETKRAVEEKVEAIRQQLDERSIAMEMQRELLPITPVRPIMVTSEVVQLGHTSDTDGKVADLNNKILELEATIIDLRENLKEKDSVIESKTKAVTLMSADLSKKGKTTLDTLEDTKDEMRTMQEHFVLLETSLKSKNENLLEQLHERDSRILELESLIKGLEHQVEERKLAESTSADVTRSTMDTLADTKDIMKSMQENFVLIESSLKLKNDNLLQQLEDYEVKMAEANERIFHLESGAGIVKAPEVEDLLIKIERYEQSNRQLQDEKYELQKSIAEMQNKMIANKSVHSNGAIQEKDNRIAELENLIDELKRSNQLLEEESKTELQKQLAELSVKNDEYSNKIVDLEKMVHDLEVEKNELASRLSDETVPAKDDEKVLQLTKELDELNKSMIKTKAQHRSKVKNLQKQLDNFKMISDANAELVRLGNQVALLEEEKAAAGDWQERIIDLESKVSSQTKEIQMHIDAIAILENQKLDLMQELHVVKQEVSALEAENAESENLRVTAEMKVVDLEEQLDSLHKSQGDSKTESMVAFNQEELLQRIETLTQQNSELFAKLSKLEEKGTSDTGSTESFETIQDADRNELLKRIEELAMKNNELTLKLSKVEEKDGSQAGSTESFEAIADTDKNELLKKIEQLTQENNDLLMKLSRGEEKGSSDTGSTESFERIPEQNESVTKIELLTQENNDLVIKLTKLEEKLGYMESGTETLKSDANLVVSRDTCDETLIQENNNLSTELTKLQMRVTELTEENVSLQKRVEQLMEENSAVLTRTATLEEQLAQRGEEKSEIEHRLKKSVHTEDELNILIQEREDLRKKLLHFEELIKQQSDNDTQHERETSDMKSRMAALVNENSEIVIKLKKLEESNDYLKENLDKVTRDRDALEVNIDELQLTLMDKLEKFKQEKESVAQEKQELQKETSTVLHKSNEELSEARKVEEVVSEQQERDVVVNLESEIEGCKKLIAEQSGAIEEMKRNLASKEEHLEKMTKQIMEYEAREVKDEDLTRELKEMQNTIEEWKFKCNDIQLRMDTLAAAKASIEADLNTLQGQNRNLVEESEQSQLAMNTLKEQLESTISQLETKLHQEIAILSTKEQEILHLKDELNNKDEELHKKYAQLQNEMIAIDTLQDDLNACRLTLQEKDETVRWLSETVDGLRETVKANEEEIYLSKKANDDLYNKLQKSRPVEEYDELLERLRDREVTLRQLQDKIDEYVTENTALLTKNEKLSTDKEAVQSELVQREQELSNLTVVTEHLNAQIADSETAKTEAEKRASSLQSVLDKNAERIDDLQLDLKNGYLLLEQLKIKHTEDMEMQNRSLEKVIEDLNAKLRENEVLRAELNEKDALIGQNVTEEMKNTLETQNAELQQKLAESENKMQAQLEKMKKIAVALKKKTAMCQELEGRVVELEQKWTTEKDEKEANNKKIQEVESAMREKDNKIAELEERLEQMRNETTGALTKADELETELRTSKEKMMTLIEQITEMSDEIEKLRANAENLNAELAAEKEAKQKILAEYEERLVQETESKQAVLDEVKENARELSVRMEVMEKRYVEQLSQIKNLEAENGLLLSKHAQINEKLENTEKESEERQALIEQLRREIASTVSTGTQAPAEDSGDDETRLSGVQHCEHCEQCQTVVMALEAKLQERQAEIENLDNELANSIGNMYHMRTRSVGFNDAMNGSSAASSNLVESYNNLLFQYNSLMTSNEEIKTKLDDTARENKELLEKIESLQALNVTLEERIVSVEQELMQDKGATENTQNVDVLYADLVKKHEQQDADLRLAHEEVQAARDRFHQYEQELASRTSQFNTERLSLTEKYESLCRQKDNLLQEIEATKTEKDTMKERISLLESELSEEKRKNMAARELEKSKLLNEGNVSESHVIEGVDNAPKLFDASKIFGMSSVPDTDQRETTRLQNLLSEKEAQNNALTKDFSQLQKQIVEERLQMTQNYDRCLNDSRIAQERCHEIQLELERAQNALTEKNTQVETLSTELSNVQTQMKTQLERQKEYEEKFQAMVSMKDKEIEELSIDLNSTKGALELLSTERNDQDQSLEACKLQIASLKTELRNVTGNDSVSELKNRISIVLKEKDFLILQINDLTRALEDSRHSAGKVHELETKIADITRERDATKEEIVELTRALKEHKSILAAKAEILHDDSATHVTEEQTSVDTAHSVDTLKPVEESYQQSVHLEVSTAWDSGSNEKLNVDEDTWGWNAEDAQLAEDQQMSASSLIPSKEMQLQAKVDELQDRINELEAEKAKMTEDNKVAQIRSGKLVKRLKEYKAQTENLQQQLKIQKSAGEFCELDSAIEEELKSQIKTLEQSLSKLKEEHKNVTTEKEALLQRLDVVVSANERYMEMKERQDMDVDVLRIQNKELSNKLQSLEWRLQERGSGSESTEPPSVPDQTERMLVESDKPIEHGSRQKREVDSLPSDVDMCAKHKAEIDDLKDEMEALATENEQLQHYLEEQKVKISSLESKLASNARDSIVLEESTRNNTELRNELDKTKQEYDVLRKQYEQSLMDANDQVTAMRQNSDLFKAELTETNVKLETEIHDLRQQAEEFASKVSSLEKELQSMREEKNAMEERIIALTNMEEKVTTVNSSLAEVTDLLNARVQEVAELKQELQRQYVDRDRAEARLQETIQALNQDLHDRKRELDNLGQAFSAKENELMQQKSIDTVSAVISQATQELSQRHAIEIEDKNKELQKLNEKLLTLQASVDEYLAALQRNAYDIDAQQQEANRLKQELLERDTVLNTTMSRLAAAEDELAKTQSIIIQQEEGFKNSALHTEGRLAQLEERVKNYEIQQQRDKQDIDRLQVDSQRVESLETELKDKAEALSQLNTQVGQLKRSLGEKECLIETLNIRLDDKQHELDKLLNPAQVSLHPPSASSTLIDGLPVFKMGNDDDSSVQATIDELKTAMEVKQQEIERLKHILSENTYPRVIQEMQDRIDCIYEEKSQLEAALRTARQTLIENQKEIENLKQMLDVQRQEFVAKEEANMVMRDHRLTTDQEEILRLQNEIHTKEQTINELMYVMAEKDSQLSLQASMEPQSDEFELQETIQRLTSELYGERQLIQNLKATIDELQNEIAKLKEAERFSMESKIAIERLTSEKEGIRVEAEQLLERTLKKKEMEIDEIKQKLSAENIRLLEELQLRDKDVENLRTQLGQFSGEWNQKLHSKEEELLHATAELAEKERRLAELSITKDAELHNLKVQIHEKDVRIEELLTLSAEEERQLSELRLTLEAREAEIHSLKEQLDNKVKEFEMIQRALKKDVSVLDIQLSQVSEVASTSESKDIASNELDLALYMLHQRDVRCEELTHELMQLLEERDTLQLRLSNAIRVNEELRRTASADMNPRKDLSSSSGSDEPLIEKPSPSKSEGPIEIAKEAIHDPIGENKEALAEKLSQLHTVGHAKDVRLKDERELRHTQQMSLLAHKDVLSTLPPEAAARLVNANYTLSRDVQSQSSVLLNWLWGKSTPKVVHM